MFPINLSPSRHFPAEIRPCIINEISRKSSMLKYKDVFDRSKQNFCSNLLSMHSKTLLRSKKSQNLEKAKMEKFLYLSRNSSFLHIYLAPEAH